MRSTSAPVLESLRGRVRSLPPIWLDVGLVVLVLAVQLWPFLARVNPSGRPWHWWGYVVVTAAALPVLWRRRSPIAALLVSLAATGFYDAFGDVPSQPIWYGGLVTLYAVAVRSPQRIRVAALVLTVGGSLLIGSFETALRSGVLFIAAYAIGRAEPFSIHVETFGTSTIDPAKVTDLVQDYFDFRPGAIIQRLGLLAPIYRPTAAYGHFGREGFPWERTEAAADLRRAAEGF